MSIEEAVRRRSPKECLDLIKDLARQYVAGDVSFAVAETACLALAEEGPVAGEIVQEIFRAAEGEKAAAEFSLEALKNAPVDEASLERKVINFAVPHTKPNRGLTIGSGKASAGSELLTGVGLAKAQPKVEPKEAEEELAPEDEEPEEPAEELSREEACVEDADNPANDVRRRLWRLKAALEWIKPVSEEVAGKVAGVLWRLSRGNRQAGRDIWVAWLGEEKKGEAQRLWDAGFDGTRWCAVEELYEMAQRAGWRFPVAQNLNDLGAMTERVEGALMRAGADIYRSENRLVRPVIEEVEASKGRKTRVATLVGIDHSFLKAELSHYVDFVSWKKEAPCGIGVPPDVVSSMLSRYGKWKFPEVSGVITCPTLRPSGTVLATEGWDRETGLLVVGPLPEMPGVNPRPGKKEAERAVEIINGLLEGFPFVDPCSRSAALSGLMSPWCVVR